MRHYLILLNLVWTFSFLGLVGLGWLVDPYRIFHKTWFGENYYVTDALMRDAVAGIINTEKFDSVILGSSMAANFSATEASQIFGGEFVNISLDGSSISERSMVLSYALRKKKIDQIIFSLDWLTLDTPSVANTPIAPYAFLYDDSRWNDLQIYATNFKAIRYAFCPVSVFSGRRHCKDRKNNLGDLVGWHANYDDMRRFGGFDNWLLADNNDRVRDALRSVSGDISAIQSGVVKSISLTTREQLLASRQQVFNETVMRIAQANPETHFSLFFPPYSRLRYSILKQGSPDEFEAYLDVLRFVVADSAQYPNVRVFGFETEAFLDDLANYKDTSHYHQRYNSQMLQWMKVGAHQLSPSTLEDYIRQISLRAANYSLWEIGRKINRYLVQ